MRLPILDRGHRLRTRLLFLVIRAISRLPAPDAVKLNRYRADFYGGPMRTLTQIAMRGPSSWSVGDRELMGAIVSQANECAVCTRTHAGVARLAYGDDAAVSSALADIGTATIPAPLRAVLGLLQRLTRRHAVDPQDMRAALAAGVTREQLEDALAVCYAFNTVDRLSRAFGFEVTSDRAFEAGARFLLARGYR